MTWPDDHVTDSVLDEIIASWRELAEFKIMRDYWGELRPPSERTPETASKILARARSSRAAADARLDNLEQSWRRRAKEEA